MSKFVIRVGKLYYSDSGSSGRKQLVREPNQATIFDGHSQLNMAHGIARDLGGNVVPYDSEDVVPYDSGDVVPYDFWDESETISDIDIWMEKHAPYILNCTGPTLNMLQQYITWCTQSKREYDMSGYMKGIPCALDICTFQRTYIGIEQSRHCFVFVLCITRELTPEQRNLWHDSNYGILLQDGRRILTSGSEALPLEWTPVRPRLVNGRVQVEDTEERRSLVAAYEESLQERDKKLRPDVTARYMKKMGLRK